MKPVLELLFLIIHTLSKNRTPIIEKDSTWNPEVQDEASAWQSRAHCQEPQFTCLYNEINVFRHNICDDPKGLRGSICKSTVNTHTSVH